MDHLHSQLRDEAEVRRVLEEENVRLTRALEEDQSELNYLNQLTVEQKQTIDVLRSQLQCSCPSAQLADLEACIRAKEFEVLTERQRREGAERTLARLQQESCAGGSVGGSVGRGSVGRLEDWQGGGGNLSSSSSSAETMIPRYVSLIKEKNIEILHLNKILKEVQKQAQLSIAQLGLDGATAALLQSKEVEIDTLSTLVMDLKARLAPFLPEESAVGDSTSSRFWSGGATPRENPGEVASGRLSAPILTYSANRLAPSTPPHPAAAESDHLTASGRTSSQQVQIRWAPAAQTKTPTATASPVKPSKGSSTPTKAEPKRKSSLGLGTLSHQQISKAAHKGVAPPPPPPRSRTPTKQPSSSSCGSASGGSGLSCGGRVNSSAAEEGKAPPSGSRTPTKAGKLQGNSSISKRSRPSASAPSSPCGSPRSQELVPEDKENDLSYTPAVGTGGGSTTTLTRNYHCSTTTTSSHVVRCQTPVGQEASDSLARSYALSRRALVSYQQPTVTYLSGTVSPVYLASH